MPSLCARAACVYESCVVADAKFWVGRGDKPSPQGIRIPDENGKEVPLRKYDKKTIVLTLPGVRHCLLSLFHRW